LGLEVGCIRSMRVDWVGYGVVGCGRGWLWVAVPEYRDRA
jgi:hypothetical protein